MWLFEHQVSMKYNIKVLMAMTVLFIIDFPVPKRDSLVFINHSFTEKLLLNTYYVAGIIPQHQGQSR